MTETRDPGQLRTQTPPDLFLLCFSLGDPTSLLSCLSEWWSELRLADAPVVLVGCQADRQRGVQKEQVRPIADQLQAVRYCEISAFKSPQPAVDAVFELAFLAVARRASSLSPGLLRGRPRSRKEVEARPAAFPGLRSVLSRPEFRGYRDSSLRGLRSSKSDSLSSASSLSRSPPPPTSSSSSSSNGSRTLFSITTRTPRPRRRSELRPTAANNPAAAAAAERMVTIRCERLTADKQYEQVEIEIPLSVYNNMQEEEKEGGPQGAGMGHLNRNSANRKSLVKKLKNLFV